MPGYQEKITRHNKRQKHSWKRQGKHENRLRYSSNVGISDQEFRTTIRGAWVAQSVKRPTLGFGSGRDLSIMRSSPKSGWCSVWSLLETLSPSPSAPPPCSLSLPKKKNKTTMINMLMAQVDRVCKNR